MSSPPPVIQLKPFATGQETVTLTPGEDDLVLAGPIDEPISAGDPPVVPNLCKRLSTGWPLRAMGARSGHRITSPLATAQRARFTVGWQRLTHAQRESLSDFLRDEVQVGGEDGGIYGFDLEPDGPGTGVIVVRPLGPLKETHVGPAAGHDHGGVYELVEMECEEVF